MTDAPMYEAPDGTRRPMTADEIAARPGLPPPPRSALGSALRDALKAQGWDPAWQTALTGQSQDTRDWWTSGYRDQIPINATKLVRIAGTCVPKVDLPTLYTAAGA